MPESVTDRCTKSHEYIFLLSKSAKYFYDAKAIEEDAVYDVDGTGTLKRKLRQKDDNKLQATDRHNGIRKTYSDGKNDNVFKVVNEGGKRNKRSVWTVAPSKYKEAHFATYPELLITDCIKAGCPKDGIVLDPFMGSGTTAVVASKLNRKYVGFELNPDYIKMAQKRLYKSNGIFY